MAAQTLDRRIEVTAGVCGGKPRIAGHRITIQNIVVWHEGMNIGADEISARYNISLADVYAALAYYFANREQIDKAIHEEKAFVKELREKSSSKLKGKLDESTS